MNVLSSNSLQSVKKKPIIHVTTMENVNNTKETNNTTFLSQPNYEYVLTNKADKVYVYLIRISLSKNTVKDC